MTTPTPPGTADLNRLALAAGIEPAFHDIWGNCHEVALETKRGLLAAMGFRVDTEPELAESLAEISAAPWRRLMPPVVVVDAGDTVAIDLVLADTPPGTSATWRLDEESGTVHRGEVALDQLQTTGESHRDGSRRRRAALVLPIRPPLGYHHLGLSIAATGQSGQTTVIVAPRGCFGVAEAVPNGRGWGLGVQLYGLRSATNWGIGDFGDLAVLAEIAGGQGAAFVGVNPLHALFPADPAHLSPYSPSDRRFLNILHISVAAVPDLAECDEAREWIARQAFQDALAAARAAAIIDYPAVAALKLPVLELLYRSFQRRHLAAASPRAAAFRRFTAEMGAAFDRHARFDALHEHFFRTDPGRWAWSDWPEPFRRPDSPEVAAFAAAHADRIGFFQYLQWLADDQLAAAASRGRAAGLRLGLYRDLAVAGHPGGGAAWADQDAMMPAARVGAPPDPFNLLGQNWGLAPFSPVGLANAAYEPYIALLRANMRHAGVLRIDHVMALQHLFCYPVSARDGAYLGFPFADLLRILALESRRNHCVVIGEDLGTVPEGFRPALQHAGVLSCRVLYFERNDQGEFLAPPAWPELAMVTVTTHDLATLHGYWSATDLAWRRQLGLYPDEDSARREAAARDADRGQLLRALAAIGALSPPWQPGDPWPEMTPALVAAVYRLLAQSPGQLLMVQIEDILGEIEQPNLPGTIDQHPNWRRRLGTSIEALTGLPAFSGLAAALRGCGR
ncbi:MAG: 4-alpha-glucanotransferase [Azospirillum sp.]|nr:4-alpha-glucanotransferase [Azospirillum sp.]